MAPAQQLATVIQLPLDTVAGWLEVILHGLKSVADNIVAHWPALFEWLKECGIAIESFTKEHRTANRNAPRSSENTMLNILCADDSIVSAIWWATFALIAGVIIRAGFGTQGVRRGALLFHFPRCYQSLLRPLCGLGSYASRYQSNHYGGETPRHSVFSTLTQLGSNGLIPLTAIAIGFALASFAAWMASFGPGYQVACICFVTLAACMAGLKSSSSARLSFAAGWGQLKL